MNLSCFSFDIGENFVGEKRLVYRENQGKGPKEQPQTPREVGDTTPTIEGLGLAIDIQKTAARAFDAEKARLSKFEAGEQREADRAYKQSEKLLAAAGIGLEKFMDIIGFAFNRFQTPAEQRRDLYKAFRVVQREIGAKDDGIAGPESIRAIARYAVEGTGLKKHGPEDPFTRRVLSKISYGDLMKAAKKLDAVLTEAKTEAVPAADTGTLEVSQTQPSLTPFEQQIFDKVSTMSFVDFTQYAILDLGIARDVLRSTSLGLTNYTVNPQEFARATAEAAREANRSLVRPTTNSRVAVSTSPRGDETPLKQVPNILATSPSHHARLQQLTAKLRELEQQTLARFNARPQTVETGKKNEEEFREGVLAAFREANLKPPPAKNITLAGFGYGRSTSEQLKTKLDGFLDQAHKKLLQEYKDEVTIANMELLETNRQTKIQKENNRKLAERYDLTFREIKGYITRYDDAIKRRDSRAKNSIFEEFVSFLNKSLGFLDPDDALKGFYQGGNADYLATQLTEKALGIKGEDVARAREAYAQYFPKK